MSSPIQTDFVMDIMTLMTIDYNIALWQIRHTNYMLMLFYPLTAGAAYIRVFIFYQHIKYH